MTLFALCSIIIALSAMFGYINTRFLKLPNTIGLMIVAICFTLFLLASTLVTNWFLDGAHYLISKIDFGEVLLDVMLGFLLFAGALHTNFDQLKVQRWPVLVFSTLGVLVSTLLIGVFVYFGFRQLGLNVDLIHCFLFGALISPTDPIAVLGILKQARVPKKLETKIVGESLFNDGVGVVVFLTILKIAGVVDHGHSQDHAARDIPATPIAMYRIDQVQPVRTALTDDGDLDQAASVADVADDLTLASNHSRRNSDSQSQPPTETNSVTAMTWEVVKLFGTEVLGGLLLGLAFGTATYWLLRSIDDYEIEVLITLACVMGGYSLASYLHLSAPLATVVAGLIVGNDTVRGTVMSQQTEAYVDKFWELVDILLNAILFVLIGLELLVLSFDVRYLWAGALAIVVVLICRFLSLLIPVQCFKNKLKFVPHTTTIMTWGGLRGGISIALALSLPAEMNRDLWLTVTYIVVIFSIIVQGLTVGPLAKRLIGTTAETEPAPAPAH